MVIPGIETYLVAIVTYVLYIDFQDIVSLEYIKMEIIKIFTRNYQVQQFILHYIC